MIYQVSFIWDRPNMLDSFTETKLYWYISNKNAAQKQKTHSTNYDMLHGVFASKIKDVKIFL